MKLAVFSDESAISVAGIRREKDTPPSLEFCDVQAIETMSVRDAELARITKQHELDHYPCHSVLELGEYHLLMVEAPDVQADEVRSAIRFRIRDLIDFDINDAVVDVFDVPNAKSAGSGKMVYAVVARASRVKERINRLNEAGLQLDIIDIPELALRNVASLLPEDVAGVALLYVDSHQGLITITKQSQLYLSRTINAGYERLPEAILSVMDDDDCLRWLDQIVIEVQRSMDYYESHFGQPQVSSLVMSPLGKEIPGMTEYLSDQLQINVRILDVNELIDTKESISNDMQSRCLLAIGTALRQEQAA
ncbi:MAG: pilus assembly protein PilM [Pseudomonadota bacterium]